LRISWAAKLMPYVGVDLGGGRAVTASTRSAATASLSPVLSPQAIDVSLIVARLDRVVAGATGELVRVSDALPPVSSPRSP
jgi:hypothetical protein